MDLSRMTQHVRNNYVPVPEAGCWLWLGCWHRNGYGKLSNNSKNTIVVSRLFYEFHRGPIPEGMQVCHKCDTPACVNPDHLFLGTNRDNAIDREKKQRGRYGWHIPPTFRRAKHKPYLSKPELAKEQTP